MNCTLKNGLNGVFYSTYIWYSKKKKKLDFTLQLSNAHTLG